MTYNFPQGRITDHKINLTITTRGIYGRRDFWWYDRKFKLTSTTRWTKQNKLMNYLEALNYGNSILKIGNIKSYLIDSELLLSKVLDIPREQILINLKKNIDVKKLNLFKNLLLKRKKKNQLLIYLKKKFLEIYF